MNKHFLTAFGVGWFAGLCIGFGLSTERQTAMEIRTREAEAWAKQKIEHHQATNHYYYNNRTIPTGIRVPAGIVIPRLTSVGTLCAIDPPIYQNSVGDCEKLIDQIKQAQEQKKK